MVRRLWFLAMLALGIVAATIPGLAQNAALSSDVIPAQIAEQRAAFARAQQQAEDANRRAQSIGARAERLSDAADRDRAAIAALALRITAAEADIAAIRSQQKILAALQAQQRARLAARQRPLAELLATLQLLTRRPPVSLFAQPGTATEMVHARAMLDGVLPAIRRQTAGLRQEITRSRQLAVARTRTAASLTASLATLAQRRTELARSEAQQRQRATALESSAGIEGDRAIALGEDAEDIGSLIGKLEESGAVRDRLAELPGPVARPGTVRGDRGGSTAIVAAADPRTRGAYRLPVIGTVTAGLGEIIGDGTRSRGLTIATAASAQVVAPAAGRVVYAGPFRSFGRIVIIDHGDGWTSLVTNMIALSCDVGDRVDQGSPIGRAGPGHPRITVELRRAGQPVDIATLVS